MKFQSGHVVSALAIMLGMACGIASADPVEWRIEDGGNGHYYEKILTAEEMTWQEVRAAAESRQHAGLPGHLVTMATEEENNFLIDMFPEPVFRAYWVGGLETDGAWGWVTGENFSYTNWHPNGEPVGGIYMGNYVGGQPQHDWTWWAAPEGYGLSGYYVEYEPPASQIAYPDFSSVDGLNIYGDAFQHGSVLRLTPSDSNQAGQAYYHEQQYVEDGFRSIFEFSISEIAGAGADGITFWIQKPTPPGEVFPYLHLFIDTWNPGLPNDNVFWLRLDTESEDTHLALGELPFDASDGDIHTVDMAYDGATERLTVTFDNAAEPFVDVNVDLAPLELENGMAWVGFRSSTGIAPEAHDLHSWYFYSLPVTPDADFDDDGDVDGNDFLLWQYGYGEQSTEHGFGDADYDMDVDGDDFLIWQSQFAAEDGDASGAVPEPHACVLLLSCVIAASFALRTRKGRRQ